MKRIVVIGASAMDVIAKSASPVRPKDSNPGQIELSPGGVGRNICVNLKRLEEDVTFVSVFGQDPFSQTVKKELESIGVDLSTCIEADSRFPMFVSIHQPTGELLDAVSDFTMLEQLTFEKIQEKIGSFPPFDIAVFDSNVSDGVIQAFAKAYPETYLCVDGVSQAKVSMIRSVLPEISLLKLNQNELSALLGKPADDVILALKELLTKGIKQVIVTNGDEPITYNIGRSIYQTVVFEPEISISTLGCGDALFAGTIYGIAHGKSMHEALNYGKNAASLTMEIQAATHPQLSKSKIEHDL